tara:strand:+ start:329 stop:625 length:297 start_codon:yes stop_codon:yes gene_type:complete
MPSLLLLLLLLFTTIANGQGTRRSHEEEMIYLKKKFFKSGSAGIKGPCNGANPWCVPDFGGRIGFNGHSRPTTNHQKVKARTKKKFVKNVKIIKEAEP